jgi:carbonic anhydrase
MASSDRLLRLRGVRAAETTDKWGKNMKIIAVLLIGGSFAATLPAEDHKLDASAVLGRLRQGNKSFVAGRLTPGQASAVRRSSLVASQHPLAVVLTCADSRVPPELIFNEGLGRLFVIRVAGAVADPVVVGSVDYAAEHLQVPLVVVMGHTRCGAVRAALDSHAPETPGGPGANIEAILSMLRPGIPKGEGHLDQWKAAVYGGVEQSVEDLLRLSKILPEMGNHGAIGVVGAVYELETGKVVFSDMVALNQEQGSGDDGVRLVKWSHGTQVAATR